MLFPQKCSVTGWDHGDLMDMGVTIPAGRDWHLYLRTSVIEEAAGKLGMVTATKFADIRKENAELGKSVEELTAKVAVFQTMIDAISNGVESQSEPAAKKPTARKKVAA